MQVAARIRSLIELEQRAVREHLLNEAAVLFLGTVAPDDAVGLGLAGHLVDPCGKALVVHGARSVALDLVRRYRLTPAEKPLPAGSSSHHET